MHGILGSDAVRTLLVVADEANITRAGERLGLTQQAVSAQIKRLEASLGRQLVERHGKGVRVTRDGEALLAFADQVAEIDRRVRRHFSSVSVSGSIRVGVLEGFISSGFSGVLAALRAAQPNLDIIVEAADTERMLSRLDNGKLDVVVGLQRRGQSRGEGLWTDHVCWFGDAAPYTDARIPVRLVVLPEPSLLRTIMIEKLIGADRRFAIQFESNSRAGIRAAALAGLGMTAVFRSFEDGAAHETPPGLPELEPAEFFMRADRTNDEAIRLFTDLIRDCARSVLREQPAFAKAKYV